MNFKELNLKARDELKDAVIKLDGDKELHVRRYLPIAEKTALIEYVVTQALDQNTGRFSPIRVETFFSMSFSEWTAQYRSRLVAFLDKTGVPYQYAETDISSTRTIADVQVQIVFGR